MSNQKVIDHLFRHQYGKMVSILTGIFGLNNLETIEDAVQDTFAKAAVKWRTSIPEHPEAWLMKAARNRAIDLFRKIKTDQARYSRLDTQQTVSAIDHFFLDHQIRDSQLRMIFTACHPALDPKDQIAFALKTIAGFSTQEIASSLLLKNETIKKRLSRARKSIAESEIAFHIPQGNALIKRLTRVHEVLYLIFNEGFHSNHNKLLIRRELCGEAMRLCKMILSNENLRNGAGYALFALMCFHAARLESKVSDDFESIDLKHQNRSMWYEPLIYLGREAMLKSAEYNDYSSFHIEAAIAREHVRAPSFESTDWEHILQLYDRLYRMLGDQMTLLNLAMIHIQLNRNAEAEALLQQIDPGKLEQRSYLYFGVKAEFFKNTGKTEHALRSLSEALKNVTNNSERRYLMKKIESMK